MRRALWAALCLALPAAAFGEAGLTGGTTLTRPTSARAIAMGEAFTGVAGGIDSLGYNPAGLIGEKRARLSTFYTQGIAQDHFSFAGYAHPVPFGVVSVSGLYYNAGGVNLNLNGNNQTVIAEEDFAGMVSAAVPGPDGLSFGGTAKYYHFNLAQQATATGFAGDLGALWQSPISGLTLGASLSQLGPDVKFEQAGDPLPQTARAGAGYRLDLRPAADAPIAFSYILLTADAVRVKDMPAAAAGGIELAARVFKTGQIALRMGYVVNSDINSFSTGVGLREGRFVVDYALGVSRVFDNTQNVTLGILF